MHYAQVDGSSIAFRVDGTGPGMVLLHGTGGNAETNWGSLVDQLAQVRTVVRPDYSGSGETTDDGRSLTVAMLAAQVVAAAQTAGKTPFDLVGFSLGGSVALYVAAEYPRLVRSVVSLSGFTSCADTRQTLQFELWRDLIRTDLKAMARLLLLTGLSPDFLAGMESSSVLQAIEDIVVTNNWEGMARQVELDLTIDVSEHARRIARPSLIIGCTHDQMVPPAHSRCIAGLIPNARYLELDTGHLSMLERPDQLARSILEFVESDLA
jgi:pimeloyl-ACP methyl ester carboxylesterase